jgi:serine/threonine protein kinase/CheY-like chemotaxis protein
MEQTRTREGLEVDELLDCLRASTLLSSEDFDRAARAAATTARDGRSLAEWLVTNGLLTGFQLQAVCNRSYAELRIGNYEVLDRLGAGGMGTVFKARHRRMKRVVALKVLARALAQDPHFVQRFQREVETIARLSHPNVVMAFDAGEAEVGHFLVMEFVEGRDLASLTNRHGPLPVTQALDCILQAARGLDYAHQSGIIHRDVKPANLLLDVAGVVKVADLGLARFANRGGSGDAAPGSGITQAGGILGTVDYMAPEQAVDSTAIDHLADVYSLGASLFYLLAARPPYEAPTSLGTLLKHRDAPIPSLSAVRPDVPADVDALFRRMVAKSPADRFQSMGEVAAALEAAKGRLRDPAARPVSDLLGVGGTAQGGRNSPARTELHPHPTAVQRGTEQTVDPGASHGVETPSVVLVEPSRTQAAIIRNYLQTAGVRSVATTGSGREALRMVRDNRPDVIISALHLQDMTGAELARQVNETVKGGAAGFVLISSEAERTEVGTLSDYGRAILLQKPFTSAGLLGALSAVTARAAARATPTGRAERRILIADDSAAARLHARGVLQDLGFRQFTEAADGAAAVAAVAREKFDLIVSDYNMPFMDGRGLLGYLKQDPALAAIPVILVTTEADPEKLDAVRQLGAAAILDKSFRPAAVREILDRLAGLA